MPKKCYDCHFYDQKQGSEFCKRMMPELPKSEGAFIALNTAREICNREGDGIFVYFEPKKPAAGAAVQPDDWRKKLNEKHFSKAA